MNNIIALDKTHCFLFKNGFPCKYESCACLLLQRQFKSQIIFILLPGLSLLRRGTGAEVLNASFIGMAIKMKIKNQIL